MLQFNIRNREYSGDEASHSTGRVWRCPILESGVGKNSTTALIDSRP